MAHTELAVTWALALFLLALLLRAPYLRFFAPVGPVLIERAPTRPVDDDEQQPETDRRPRLSFFHGHALVVAVCAVAALRMALLVTVGR